ncbi:reverse transcriptase domain-containing protein [Streptomyces sp. NPDC006602]|uniref:reverse transcriptase domain-containing protein n=1 Tax=Streptomyces sp. NPDC006602 TaxID=3364751 RepID=UPI003696F4A7
MTAERRVLDHQRKLHRWARAEPDRRFKDVFNLVCDRATLLVAWERVSGNKGAKTAGVDAVTRRHVEEDIGELTFLEDLRSSLKDGTFTALPVKQAIIPKRNGKVRMLGIPTLRDRVAQMALKLILEPIFEVDFYPSSYGYRPGRRAQDAIAEIHQRGVVLFIRLRDNPGCDCPAGRRGSSGMAWLAGGPDRAVRGPGSTG